MSNICLLTKYTQILNQSTKMLLLCCAIKWPIQFVIFCIEPFSLSPTPPFTFLEGCKIRNFKLQGFQPLLDKFTCIPLPTLIYLPIQQWIRK